MPLAATDVPGVEDLDGVRFPMMDGAQYLDGSESLHRRARRRARPLPRPPNRPHSALERAATVPILVTREALEEIESPPPAPGGYVDRLQTYRSTFEDLGSIKYDAGKVENDGTIRITAADLG